MMVDNELASMVRRAQRLDAAAFEWFVDCYSARLYGFLFRLTGVRHDAEELVQEVFIRMVRMIGQYEHDGRFEAWLFRIATNLARDRIRRINRRPVTESLDEAGRDGHGGARSGERNGHASNDRPERRLELAEDVDHLQLALTRLPQAEREVIMLRHYGEMSFPEIAEMMGIATGTTKAQLHRARKLLREVLK